MARTRTGLNAIQIEIPTKEGSEVKKIKKILVQKPFPKINRLTIEGCGVRGTAIAGAIKILEKYGVLADVEAVAGTSAGAIAGLIIALGFTAQEGAEILCGMPLKEFLEGAESWSITPDKLAKLRQGLSVLFGKDHSLSSGQVFLEWLESVVARRFDKIFKEKGINKAGKDATFRDLVDLIEKTKKSGAPCPYKYLYVTATDLSISSPECRYLSHENPEALDARLADAIRASGGLPPAFKLFEWALNHHKYGDGGIMQNMPEIFEQKRFEPSGYQHELHGNASNLYIKVDTPREIKQFIWGIYEEVPVETASQIGEALYKAVSENTSARRVREGRLVLPLSDNEYGTLQFSIDNQGKVKLITSAEKTTQEFLENYIGAAYEMEVYDDIEDWLEPPEKYEFVIRSNPVANPQAGKIYIEKRTSVLRYTVMNSLGVIVTDTISEDELNHSFSSPLKLTELEPFMHRILRITAKRGHTKTKPKTLEEIDDIVFAYEEKKKNILEKNSNDQQDHVNQDKLDHDPNHPTVAELDEQIHFYKKYDEYRRNKKRNPDLMPNFIFPEHHINLTPPKLEVGWDLNVVKDMEMRLEGIKNEMNRINKHIKSVYGHLLESGVTIQVDKLHADLFDDIKHLVGFVETLKLLEEEKIDLENKLDIREEKIVSNKEASKQFELFCQEMQPLLVRHDLTSGFHAILNDLDLYDPKINYKSMNETDNIVFSLDLRNLDDRKLYLVAGLLYLENTKNKDVVILREIYKSLYQDKASALKSINDVSSFLDKKGVDLYFSLYRIEELLHWFEKSEGLEPKMDIDNILGASQWSIFDVFKKAKIKESDGVELKVSYKATLSSTPMMLNQSNHATSVLPKHFTLFGKNKEEGGIAFGHPARLNKIKTSDEKVEINESFLKNHPLELTEDEELEYERSLRKKRMGGAS